MIGLSVGELGLDEEVEGEVEFHEGRTIKRVRSVQSDSPSGVGLGGDVGEFHSVVRDDNDTG